MKSATALVIIGSTSPANTHYLLFLVAKSNYNIPKNTKTNNAIVNTPATNNIIADTIR